MRRSSSCVTDWVVVVRRCLLVIMLPAFFASLRMSVMLLGSKGDFFGRGNAIIGDKMNALNHPLDRVQKREQSKTLSVIDSTKQEGKPFSTIATAAATPHLRQQKENHFEQQMKQMNEFGGSEYGIDPVYIKLLKKAQENSEKRRQTLPPKKPVQGIVIGPTEGRFHTFTFRALQNARRIRNIIAMTNKTEIQVTLMTSQEHHDILQLCGTTNITEDEKKKLGITDKVDNVFLEACRLWDSGSLFDDVIITKLDGLQPNDSFVDAGQGPKGGTSAFWLKALGSYRNAPYQTSLFIDSDSYPCPGFEKLFLLTRPIGQKIWQLPILRPADLAIGLEQFPIAPGNFHWNPGRGQGPDGSDVFLEEFKTFSSRNTGAVLFHFDGPLALVFAEFLPLVAEHVYNHVATAEHEVPNDQTSFKIAQFVFQKLVPDFVEQQFPMHASCRSYGGAKFTGTDGYLNGMFPLQSDGKHCSECYCTPCVIVHTVCCTTCHQSQRLSENVW